MSRKIPYSAFLSVLVFLAAVSAFAQLPTGTILGVVKDTSGGSWLEPYMLRQQEQGTATLQFLGPDVELPSVFDVRFSRVPEVPVAKTLTP